MIQNLSYEFTVLGRAVQHRNLSAAAAHVGLSQPQLSRLVAKLEASLNVILLDRKARRKSGWTPIAFELTAVFAKGVSRLENDIFSLTQEREPTELHIGTLEGLADIAMQFVHESFKDIKMRKIYLDILDFQDLEAQFLNGSLDLIFSVKTPGKQKFEHVTEVGFQQMKQVTTNPKIWVGSPYELANEKKVSSGIEHFFVSNSLSLREKWLEDFGGSGQLFVDTKKGRGKGNFTVYLIGSDLISPKIWDHAKSFVDS